jgi:hypothetical protein
MPAKVRAYCDSDDAMVTLLPTNDLLTLLHHH